MPLPEPMRGRRFTTAQAHQLGLSANQLRGSAVRRVHHGGYVDAVLPNSLPVRVSTVYSVLPEDPVAVGTTALQLLGVDVPGGTLRFASTWPHLVRRKGLTVSRVSKLTPSHNRVALPAFAFTASAAELDLLRLVGAGDQLLRKGLVEVPDLAAALRPRARGAVNARRAIGLVRPAVDSVRESWLRLLLVLAGLPEPEINSGVFADGVFLGRPDLKYDAYRTALEYEGDHHRTDREQWTYDIGQYEAFTAAGWAVLRITAESSRYPRLLVMRIYDTIRARGYTGPPPNLSPEWVAIFG